MGPQVSLDFLALICGELVLTLLDIPVYSVEINRVNKLLVVTLLI